MKRCTFVEFAFDFDLAAMFLNDSVDNRQSESGSVIFRREERIEHVGEILGLNSFATVANTYPQHFGAFAIGLIESRD